MPQWRQPLLRQARDILAANNRPDEPHLSTLRAEEILEGQLDISECAKREILDRNARIQREMEDMYADMYDDDDRL